MADGQTPPTGLADPTILGGLLAGLGGLAGAFPNTANNTSRNWQDISSQSAAQTTGTSDLTTLLNILQNTASQTAETTTGTTTGTTTQNITPTLSPETYALLHQLITSYGQLTVPSLTGYGAQQTANINAASNAQAQAVNNILAARGLSTSPVAATAAAGLEQNRLNQITGMQQQLPLLRNQMNLANLAGAAGFFSTIPKGQQTTGTQTGTSTGAFQQTGTSQTTGQQTGEQKGTTTGTQTQTGTTASTGQGAQTASSGGGIGGAVGGIGAGLASIIPYLIKLTQQNPNINQGGGGGANTPPVISIGQGPAGGGGGENFFSDKILKKDIRSLSQDRAIEKVRELRTKTWKWKGGEREDSGVIAQDLEKVLPELVDTDTSHGMDLKTVNYVGLIPYLVGAVQNLDSRIG